MSFIKRYHQVIVISLLTVLIISISCAAYFFAYYSGYDYLPDDGKFNNIATPISSIASAIAVIATLLYLRSQNKMILGQIVRSNIEKEFQLLKEALELEIELKIYSEFSEPKTIKVDAITIHRLFDQMEYELSRHPDYKKDLQDYYNNILHDVTHYNDHYLYSDYIRFLNPYALHGEKGLEAVAAFLEYIIESKGMLDEDRYHFRIRIFTELLPHYMLFISRHTLGPSQFMIPLINKPDKDQKVSFVPFARTAIAKHYEFFLKHRPK